MREDDFPTTKNQVYLDSACMSLRPEQVLKKVEEYYREYPTCPGRSSYSMAERATEELENAREKIAGFIDANPENLVLTSGTTESINTVAHSFPCERVVISDREHNSNLVPWQQTAKHIETVSTKNGFNLEELEKKVGEGDLVSVVHVSNLDGYENPIEEIVRIARENGAYTLIDAAQSIPHKPFSIKELEPDFVAFSGHKMLGPSGTGALYVSERVKNDLEPFISGGGAVNRTTTDSADFREFPHNMEAGLPNIAGIIGFGAAVDYLKDIGMEEIESHEKKLTGKMCEGLKNIEKVETVGREGQGIISFRVEGVEAHQTALMLDRENISVRSGQHCVHSWFDKNNESSTVRASLYLYNNEENVEKLVEAVKKIALLS